jgi:hypothetical protein
VAFSDVQDIGQPQSQSTGRHLHGFEIQIGNRLTA